MKQWLLDILQCNMLRTWRHRSSHNFSDEECYVRFVNEMNKYSKDWGMIYTEWINPSGLEEDGEYSRTTANDLSVMALRAFLLDPKKNHNLNGYEMQIIKPYLIPGHRIKKKIIYSTTSIEKIGYDFPILSTKTGSGDGYQTLVMVCRIGDYIVSGAIMNAKDEQGRFEAMDELMKIGYSILYKHADATNLKCVNARNVCLYVSDIDDGTISCIYSQNSDEISAPMSTTKMLTITIADKYLTDEFKRVYITPLDARSDRGHDSLHRWDNVTIRDLKNAALLASSNVAANAIARLAGEQLLKQEQRKNDISTGNNI